MLSQATLDDFANARTYKIQSFSNDGSTMNIQSRLDNSGIQADYPIQMIGVVGHTDAQNNILVVATENSEGQPAVLPKETDTPYNLNWGTAITVSNSQNVTATIEAAGMVSNNVFNAAMSAKSDDSKVVHLTGDEEITGTKTFDTAPIDKTTGNPYITKDGVPTNYVKDNYDGTITANQTVFNLLKSLSASSIPQDPTKDYNTLPQGLALMSEVNGEPANMPPVQSTYLTLTIASSFAGGRKRQLAWLDAGANSSNNNFTYIRYCVGSTWSSWDSIPTSTQISSLIPSTIADTTKDTNFTGKLQKSGIDVATTNDVQNAINTEDAHVKDMLRSVFVPVTSVDEAKQRAQQQPADGLPHIYIPQNNN